MLYKDFIQNIINTRGQWSDQVKKECCERHHILPKCMGGLPKRLNWSKHENIIWLTPAEHYEAHKLLAQENPEVYGLVRAWHLMSITGDGIEVSKEEYQAMRSGLHHSDDTKKKISESLSGKPLSEDRKKKISQVKREAENYNSKPVICIETGETFSSATEAGREYGNGNHIGEVCKGIRGTSGGYHWQFIDYQK